MNLSIKYKTVKAKDFVEYPHYEIDCPNCGGVIDSIETPSDGDLVQCKECDQWSHIEGEWFE